MEAGLKTAMPIGDAAQQFQDILSHPERPVPSRRCSLQAAPATYIPPPPPPPPASLTESMRMASFSSMRSPSPSPVVDMSPGIDSRKMHHSPVRSPPSLSSAPRRNSSQAEHFARSSLSPPPSASKRAYSFAREQARIPTVPDADIMFQTRGVRSNSDGYNSASTFMTECSTSPTSSDSSQPSDIEDGHTPHIKTKAPENASSLDFAELEMESRRLELVWQETEKQWKDKHGTPLARSQDMAFRRKIEGGLGIKDDNSIDKEWRDMWKNTSNEWAESEARWRKEVAHRRSASRNDDSHFHTMQSDSRNASVADDDKVMNAILSHFEKEMEKRRQRAERKRLEEVEQAERKRREEESDIWRATLERESGSRRSSGQGIPRDFSTEQQHGWLPDRLLRPDLSRTRSSSVVVEPRPPFQRSRSGSVATVDPLAADVNISPLPTTLGPPVVEHVRVRRSRSNRDSRDGFEAPVEEDPVRIQVEKQRSEEVRKHYLNSARQHLYTPATDLSHPQPAHPRDSSEETERDTPRARGHQRGPSTISNPEAHSPRPSLSPSISTRDVPQAGQADGPLSIVEEVAKLEREQAALARRIQELRAAAEVNEGPKPAQPVSAPVLPPVLPPVLAPVEQDRGREKNKEVKVKDGEKPRAKSQVTRKHSDEGAIFKAMQERSRKTEQQGATIAPDFNRKPEPVVITPEPRPATTAPTVGEPSGGRVHFVSDKASAEDLPSPTPPRVRTPGPTKIQTPARIRTPSPRSNSPVIGVNTSFAQNVTRETLIMREAMPPVHEAVAPSSPPKVFTMPSQPTLRPAGKSRDGGLNGVNTERPKSGSMPTLGVPHVNTSTSPIDAAHDQGASPLGAKTPRATAFDPDRTPRAQAGPVPETNDKPGSPPLAPRMYVNPNQARARAEAIPVEPPVRMEDSTRRRMDAAVGANVAAAAAETFDRAGGKKRTKEAELRAQEERRLPKICWPGSSVALRTSEGYARSSNVLRRLGDVRSGLDMSNRSETVRSESVVGHLIRHMNEPLARSNPPAPCRPWTPGTLTNSVGLRSLLPRRLSPSVSEISLGHCCSSRPAPRQLHPKLSAHSFSPPCTLKINHERNDYVVRCYVGTRTSSRADGCLVSKKQNDP
ncbi:Actin cytoskeleton-regulatory complex protein PAN1 [Chaetomium globosum CBS 148,51] [Rhizoctonia solani]|uniref:Actin cytoskeleton-regulatory complex protein PAN1 [Chaetomium globosum CBS 148,51] n=1 Tax=Rhizoctonia solani TaxID=456999 RepID=A0A0K6FXT9_9AGAM|nr:Actin cytoskeleton-regulatory complex protein PAN1 [Chaetomium globosum CBS 148,51] [Rhizoctonia solani]